MRVVYEKIDENAKLPTLATDGSACYDVYALDNVLLFPGEKAKIRTGLAFECPPGWFLDIRPRGGVSFSGIRIMNSPGTYDSDYRGEMFIFIKNEGDEYCWIKSGDRIAQFRLDRIYPIEFVEGKLSETNRGSGHLGSTGR